MKQGSVDVKVKMNIGDFNKKMRKVTIQTKALSKAIKELNKEKIIIQIMTTTKNDSKRWWQFWK